MEGFSFYKRGNVMEETARLRKHSSEDTNGWKGCYMGSLTHPQRRKIHCRGWSHQGTTGTCAVHVLRLLRLVIELCGT
jgi:hypothetical protein